jgi:Na+/H+ antiporter NhaC
MEELYLSNIHWFDHIVEATALFLIVIAIIMFFNLAVHGNVDYEIEYAIKHPSHVIIFYVVSLIILIIVSHVVVLSTDVDIWHHRYYYEHQDGDSSEEIVESID